MRQSEAARCKCKYTEAAAVGQAAAAAANNGKQHELINGYRNVPVFVP